MLDCYCGGLTHLTGVTVVNMKLEQSARRDVTSGAPSLPVTARAQLSAAQARFWTKLPSAGARMPKDTRMGRILLDCQEARFSLWMSVKRKDLNVTREVET